MAVVLASQFRRAPPDIRLGCAADRAGDVLQAAGLAPAETKRGGQKRSPHGAGRPPPLPAVWCENHAISSIRFHEVRHALAPRPDSRLFCRSSAANPDHGLRGLPQGAEFLRKFPNCPKTRFALSPRRSE